MEGTSTKRQKLSGAAAGSSVDRISTLPDDVTYSILSFLPTKNSIATSVLSKRWRYVWAHVPNIDLDSENGGLNLGGASFSDIVYRVMLMYKVQNMNTFRLSYKYPCSEYQLETCIATAITRNVKNLLLDLRDQVKLPLCIFTYKTLVNLRLYSCGSIPAAAASTIYLPALKTLYLDNVRYECDKSLAHLLSGCPLLKSLTIERRAIDPLVCCSISSKTLLKLTLKTDFANDGSYTETYSVKIDAPALRRLRLWDTVSNELSCGPLKSLLKGDVRLRTKNVPVLNSHSTLELVGRLTNVKSLTITTKWLEVPQSAFLSSTMKFRNLTRLVLYADCRFLTNFLTYADNLGDLQITMVNVNHDQSCGLLPSPVPTCLSSRLQQIKIVEFRCKPNEYTMIAYFLRNAKVLKKMDIYFRVHQRVDLKAKYDALNHISSFQRGSEACQVVFH